MISIFAIGVVALTVGVFGMYCNAIVLGNSDDSNAFYDTCDYYYSFNERFGVQEPEPWLQEKRFDMKRAVAMSSVLNKEPENLDKYTLLPAASTTVIEKWNTDNVMLGSMCNWLIRLAQYSLNQTVPVQRRDRIIAVMRDFTQRYSKAMDGKFQQVFPWGNNWFEFSITSTLMLFYFIIASDRDEDRREAADLILKIIENPMKSLGRRRDQANAVYMSLPWIAAHYVKGDVYDAARDPAYEYARSYIKFHVVEKRKDEGLYLDCAYITHTNVLAYGYLSEMTRMSLPLVGLDNLMRNFLLDWRRCQRVLAHRTIGYGGIGFHSRDRRLTQFTVADSAYGIEVIPTCLFLRMYGEDYAFSMRGQVPWIAYYESDKTYNEMSQYWVQCRRVFFKGEKYEITFPDVGFVHQSFVDKEKKNPVTSLCKIPTRTSTTTSFVIGPKRNSQPLKAGFVFAYGNVGILRHFYTCPEMIYDATLQFLPAKQNVYGRFWIDEFVLCDYAKHTIDIWIKVTKASNCQFTLHGAKSTEMSDHNGVGMFHIHWDCKTRQITDDFKISSTSLDEIAMVYPKGITVVNTDNTVMLMENNVPKMAMYPDAWLDLKSNFTKYNGREYEFAFDSLTNQYWLADQCIDKI